MGVFKDVFNDLFRARPCYKCAKEKRNCGFPLLINEIIQKAREGTDQTGTRRHSFYRYSRPGLEIIYYSCPSCPQPPSILSVPLSLY